MDTWRHDSWIYGDMTHGYGDMTCVWRNGGGSYTNTRRHGQLLLASNLSTDTKNKSTSHTKNKSTSHTDNN